MNKASEQELLDRVAQLEKQVESLLQVATDSASVVDRIAKLEEQIAPLLPKQPKFDATADRIAKLNASMKTAEIDAMEASLRTITEKPPSAPLPTINGQSFYGLFRSVEPYQLLSIEELAALMETTPEQIELDAQQQNIEVHRLINLTTRLEPRLQVEGGYKYMRSLV
ncbi:hypothetical protein ACQ4M3_05190 [Leptolyngbya sp. AN03gr2]|uniref:hypothetical protein n=1 Tax=unclassified Leptolyngbya TaxID=2650499 RepID=UPI003D316E88